MINKDLFDAGTEGNSEKEVTPVERLKNLENKITAAIEKVKTLKEEKGDILLKLKEYEELIKQKDQEIDRLSNEKNSIRNQVEELLNELESLGV